MIVESFSVTRRYVVKILSRHCLFISLFLFILPSLLAQFAGGSGTASDPWQIETIEHLNNIRSYLGAEHNDKHYLQIADLDLGISPWNDGNGWIAIGHYDNPFCGTYNGNGYIIKGMIINRPNSDYQGLFGLTAGAMLSNIGLTDVNIFGNLYVGTLVGYNFDNSVIENSFSTGIVHGTSDVGGLVGHNAYATVNNSYSSGIVLGNGSNIGGLIGMNSYSTLNNCFSRAHVQGNFQVGGLVGYHFRAGIIHCYSTGVVTGSSGVGGLVGRRVTGGGFQDTNNYWNIETSGQTTSIMGLSRTTVAMTYPYAVNTYEGWDFDMIWTADYDYEMNHGYPILRDLIYLSADKEMLVQRDILTISNYPNPFNPQTTMEFTLPHSGRVRLDVYNITGQKIATLLSEYRESGKHKIVWNGRDDKDRVVTSGIYFYHLEMSGKILTGKMILVK